MMTKREMPIHISTYDRPFLVDKNDNKGLFEPTTNRHQWSRWRMAINDTLCQRLLPSEYIDEINQLPFGEKFDGVKYRKGLPDTPFRERVVVNKLTHLNVDRMLVSACEPGFRGHLGTGQFVFYGIPRVTLKNKDSGSLPGPRRMNVNIPDDTKIRKYRIRFR